MKYVVAFWLCLHTTTTLAEDFSAKLSDREKQHTARVQLLYADYTQCLKSNGIGKAKSTCAEKRNQFVDEYPPELGKLVVGCLEEREFDASTAKDESCTALQAFGKRVKAQGGRWK